MARGQLGTTTGGLMPSIGSGMPAALIEVLKARLPVHATFDLTLDQTYRFAKGSVSADSKGTYLDRVVSWGSWARRAGLDAHSLELPSTSLTVFDRDRELQKSIGGPSARNVKRAPASVWWRSFDVNAADHFNVVPGVVSDWKLEGDQLYLFEISPDFLALTAKKNNIRQLTDVDWPNIPPENIGADGQVIVGQHRSTSIPERVGMVPCIMVDQVNHLWLASIGKLFGGSAAIKKVGHNGADVTAQFSHQQVFAGNLWWTCIKDNQSTPAESGDTVAIDVDGVETNGDGFSGSLITNPLRALEFFLTNFVYNDWTAIFPGVPPGRWLVAATQTPLDPTTFGETATFLDDRDYETGYVFKSSDAPETILTTWAQSLKVFPFWRSNLKLGIRAIDANRDPYTSSNWLRQDRGAFRSEVRQDTLDAQVRTRIFVQHLLKAVDNDYVRTRRVEDARREVVVTSNQQFPFGAARMA